ncbi:MULTISPECIES: substrate-binding domain-containing protein [unclassified Flavobacterium]|uniref:substrate-binding domain-containing protein n=1 Tax=unclassified Flavobacterium TaxID=196869 RepID=UPI001F130853|nr:MULTISPECIES: substrate-binding domain-containing protein [unclassified Flavobacterium]UMY64971.1 substrate-binding domain-containing protein [Flavobacterium sp. HJ-32-4]
MKTIKIAGVPEHFNFPWYKAISEGRFAAKGLDLQWTDVPEGTGKMCQMLRDGDTDVAVILTEGIIKDIIAGNPSRIVQIYVQSPLIWGIHVAYSSDFQCITQLEGKKAAISRPGSGSQLMAYVNADQRGWDPESLTFETVHTIDGAVEALKDGRADYFMWERFMTKPLVDNGTFRRLGDCPTPWPCFVIAVREECLENDPDAIRTLLATINDVTKTFKEIPGVDELVAQRFHQKIDDIREWLSLTQWSQKPFTEEMLNNVQIKLWKLSVVPELGTFTKIAWP